MIRKSIFKKVKVMAQAYRINLAQKVRLLQKVMKGYICKKRVTAMKQDIDKYTAATTI